MLQEADYEDQFEEINGLQSKPLYVPGKKWSENILVAGSLSHMIPIPEGTGHASKTPPSADFMEETFEGGNLHKELGCDLILLEMMKHPERINMVMKGAWKPDFHNRQDFPSVKMNPVNSAVMMILDFLPEVLDTMPPESVDVMGVMHSSANITGRGIKTIQNVWSGPLSSYPDSGFFKMPDWQFENILTPQDLLDFSKEWYGMGTRILGDAVGLDRNTSSTLELKS